MSAAASDCATVFAPATVANVGPGFDALGFALDAPGDTVTVRLVEANAEASEVRIVGVRGADVPTDPARNTAGVAAVRTLERAGVRARLEIEIDKGLPIGSGLGSSAASAAAAAYATNLVLGSPLRKAQLIEPCMDAEAVVAGRHADNVAPALLGGLVLVRSTDPLDLVRLPVPDGLLAVTVTPAFELPTERARAALPATVPLAQMTQNVANVAALVSACYSGDLGLLGRALHDPVVTPARAALIPGGAEALDAARQAGALGASISGAGPTVFAFCHTAVVADAVRAACAAAFRKAGLESVTRVSPAECGGVRAQ